MCSLLPIWFASTNVQYKFINSKYKAVLGRNVVIVSWSWKLALQFAFVVSINWSMVPQKRADAR